MSQFVQLCCAPHSATRLSPRRPGHVPHFQLRPRPGLLQVPPSSKHVLGTATLRVPMLSSCSPTPPGLFARALHSSPQTARRLSPGPKATSARSSTCPRSAPLPTRGPVCTPVSALIKGHGLGAQTTEMDTVLFHRPGVQAWGPERPLRLQGTVLPLLVDPGVPGLVATSTCLRCLV